ncbi:MAG: sulfopyruvate decarboxylase subunit alpha [Anaerolineae bacterium]
MTNISNQLLTELKANGADYFASVPCKLLGDLINLLGEEQSVTYVPVAREEEGLGLCAGAFLGGKTPVLVMQNTGLGTIITSLFSLGLFYNLPITMIISHRGTPGEKIGTQVPMSNAVKPLLDTVGIPYFAFSDPAEVGKVGRLVQHAQVAQRPVAALLDFDFWGKA